MDGHSLSQFEAGTGQCRPEDKNSLTKLIKVHGGLLWSFNAHIDGASIRFLLMFLIMITLRNVSK